MTNVATILLVTLAKIIHLRFSLSYHRIAIIKQNAIAALKPPITKIKNKPDTDIKNQDT